ncbi:MAG: PKD domain-containing protein [Bacteroidia bacterium]
MKKSRIVFILILALKFTTAVSQIDTCFWFAAPWITPDHWWKDNVVLHISTFNSPSTTVRLRQPAAIAPNRYDTTIVIGPNQTFDYTFWRDKIANSTNLAFDSLETRPANTVLPYGLYISSTASITVVYDSQTRSPSFLNPETYSMKGQNGLGTEFLTPFQTFYRNETLGGDLNGDAVVTQPKQQINIVATRPNTTVWITPKCNIVGHAANVTYSVFLPSPGSAYTCENSVQNTYVAGNTLSGSIIVSDKPIAVTVADDSVNNPLSSSWGGLGCYDQMGDQIVPVDVLGTDYILNLGQLYKFNQISAGNPGMKEAAYIVATDNYTQLTINDGTVTTVLLNKGDTYMDSLFQPLTYVHADKNVYVIHASGYGCELGEAIIPPLNCAGSKLVAFSRNSAQRFCLNILCKSGSQSTFTLNASTSSVTAANFTMVPGTGTLTGGPYYGAQINLNSTAVLPIGSYTIGNNSNEFALGVFDGDFTSGGLFHYMSSFLRKVNIDAGPTFTLCAGQSNTVSLNGLVSGGAITGIWSNINGTGAIGTPTNLNTTYTLSANDTTKTQLAFLLTSTGNCTPVTDTFYVKINKAPAAKVVSTKTITLCKNNVSPITLTGTIVNAVGALWSGGTGSYGNSGALSTTYLPSPGDLSTGSLSIVFSPTGTACPGKSDTVKVFFTNPPSVTALAPSFICTSSPSVALSGTVTGGSTTGIWSTNGTGGFNPNDTLVNTNYLLSPSDYTIPGNTLTFTFTSTHNGLCSAVNTTLQISVVVPDKAITGPNDTICATAGVIPITGTIVGTSSSPQWSTLGSGSFGNNSSLSTFYTMSPNDTLSGSVSLILTPVGGLCPGIKDTIRYAILKAPLVNAGRDSSYCNNIRVPLNGLVAGFTNTGQWSASGTGTFTPNNSALNGYYTPSLSDVSIGSVTLTLQSTNNKGCNPQNDKVVISFKPSPTANFSFTNACVGQPVIFNDNSSTTVGTLTGGWNFGDNTTAISLGAIHGYSLANTYTVTHWVQSSLPNGCYDTVQKVITVNSVPFPNFYYDAACENQVTAFYDSSFISPGNVIAWNWNFADGDTSHVKNPTHTYLTAGLYNVSFTVTSNNNCTSVVTKTVNVRPHPTANFGMTNNPTLAQQTVYFSDFSTPTSSLANWNWDFGDTITSNLQNPSHLYNNQGDFIVTLTVTDKFGCSDTARKPISVALLPLVPTAFSPNNSGHNDYLFVKGGPFQHMNFRVYNNWGALIFETTDQKTGWDGKYQGEDQPVGVYVWVLDVDMYNNKSVRKTGDVTLLR